MKKKINWLLFHEPAELFIRTAEHFAEELNALSGDQYEFEIMKLEDYEAKYYNGKRCDPIEELKSGRVQMSQLYIEALAVAGATNFNALALPYIFEDHPHATRVFESDLGEELLDHVDDTVGIKGLSFTYSGGYKCIAANKPITNIDEFNGLNYQIRLSPVADNIFQALGATPTERDTADFRDTTFPRYHADATNSQRWAIDTGHAMYLTTLLINSEMWSDMSSEEQSWFAKAAKVAARAERLQSVADAEEIATNKTLQHERGIDSVINLSEAEHKKLRSLLEPVLNAWKPLFPNQIVERIQAA